MIAGLHRQVVADGSVVYNMEKNCGRLIILANYGIPSAEVGFSRSPTFFGSRSCNLGISSGNWWAGSVTWNKIIFQILEFKNEGESCVEFRQSTDKVNWEKSNKPISGLNSEYCGSNRPPINQSFTTGKYNSLVIKFDAANYLDDSFISFKLFLNVLHSDGSCNDYECDNGNCIPTELKCNGYNPCGDKSDCRPDDGLPIKTIIFIVIGVVGGLVLLVLVVKYIRCSKVCKENDTESVVGGVVGEEEEATAALRERDRERVGESVDDEPPRYSAVVGPSAPPLLPHTDEINGIIDEEDIHPDTVLAPPSYEEATREESK